MNIFRVLRLPDVLSLLNALFGFCALLAAYIHQPYLSAVLVFFSGASDGMDGFLARRFSNSQLGPSLDSLADLISFGAAPAFLAITLSGLSLQSLIAGAVYLICGTLRLARFNVSSKSDNLFEGFPITASGIAVAASVFLESPTITLILMIVLSAFMVSSVSYPKVRDYRFVAALVAVFLAAAALFWHENNVLYPAVLLFLSMMVYLASPVVIEYIRKRR